MNERDQRMAIAKFDVGQYLCGCGLHWRQNDHFSCGNTVDDYLHDLNAMHRVEEKAGMTVIKAMPYYLWKMCDQMTAHHATAAQHAEAFLRAANLWKE